MKTPPSGVVPFGLGIVPGKAKRKTKPKTVKLPLEKDVQKAIQQAFRLKHGIYLVHVDAGGAGMRTAQVNGHRVFTGLPEGFPDLIGVIPPSGRALYIEVKRPGQKPRPNQEEYLAFVRSKGAIAFWADSVESALAQFLDAVNGGPEAA